MVRETPGNFLAKILEMAAKGRGERRAAKGQINHSETKQFPALVKIPNPQEQKLKPKLKLNLNLRALYTVNYNKNRNRNKNKGTRFQRRGLLDQ